MARGGFAAALDRTRSGARRRVARIPPAITTTVPSATVNRLRAKGYGLLFLHRVLKRPIRTWKLLRTFGRHMRTSDIVRLLASPFRRRTLTRKAELPAWMTPVTMILS